MTDEPLLTVDGLTTEFDTDNGVLTAVDGIDFEIPRGETVCLVGESGSGKTVASESITRIVPTPPGEVTGSVKFDGEEITALSESELREIRGGRIAHVFQNPQDALNHCYTVGWQIVEAIQTHEPDTSEQEARERAIDLLNDVGVANAAARLDDYPTSSPAARNSA
ncbi:dipeptide transporter ATP-binding subunit [Halolamina pelagica]|uniref:Dipeptide transporter ATP-binding subunit n=1 Tax=Halolamina pelagica TaxID=699431 RepID=A0A0P7HV27_9EURY|nr:dipeptide transporter ATP-binding subunit [Halolamina pelagica]